MSGNRKAQIGKFLTGFVSFLLIILFIGVFIALSSVLAKSKNNSEIQKTFFSAEDNLALEEVEIDIEGKRVNMMIADALIYNHLGKGRNIPIDLQQFFRKKVEEGKGCILFFTTESETNNKIEGTFFRGYYQYEEGKAEAFESIQYKGSTLAQDSSQTGIRLYRIYWGKGVLQKSEIEFNQNGQKKMILIESYSGPCLEEGRDVK